MPSNHLILCHPLLLLPSIPPSIRVFFNESALRMRWPKYWSFSFNINTSNEHSQLISFRMDWLDLLAVQGTLKSLIQHQKMDIYLKRVTSIKDRNGMDLTDAEDIKKRWQEYWSRLPFPSPGDLPDPGIEPRSPTLQADTLTSEPPGKPLDCKEIQPVHPKGNQS